MNFIPQRVRSRWTDRTGVTASKSCPGRIDPEVAWIDVIWDDNPTGAAEKTLTNDLVFGGNRYGVKSGNIGGPAFKPGKYKHLTDPRRIDDEKRDHYAEAHGLEGE